MSEDSITLVYRSTNLYKKNYKNKLEKCYKSHVQCYDNSNSLPWNILERWQLIMQHYALYKQKKLTIYLLV